MQRRNFLKGTALAAGSMTVMPSMASASMIKPEKAEKIPSGAVTLYFEFRIIEKFKDDMLL